MEVSIDDLDVELPPEREQRVVVRDSYPVLAAPPEVRPVETVAVNTDTRIRPQQYQQPSNLS